MITQLCRLLTINGYICLYYYVFLLMSFIYIMLHLVSTFLNFDCVLFGKENEIA